MERPLIDVNRKYETEGSVRLEFTVRKSNENIGYMVYNVLDKYVTLDDGTHVKEDYGRIVDIVLDREYQKCGILTDIIDRVFCDLKCKGAEKTVTLNAQCPPEVWEKFGFKLVNEKNKLMTKDISDLECTCLSSALGLSKSI